MNIAPELLPAVADLQDSFAGRFAAVLAPRPNEVYLHVPADLVKRLGRQLAGDAHPGDRVGVLDLGLTKGGPFLPHVLGARDVRGNLPGRRYPTRVEQSGHVLRV